MWPFNHLFHKESKRGTRKDPSWQDLADTDGVPAAKLPILGYFSEDSEIQNPAKA